MEASGPTVFAVKKQGDITAGHQLPFLFPSVQGSSPDIIPWTDAVHISVGLISVEPF